MQYEPYFSDTPIFDPAEYAAAHGVSPRMHYDALGRPVRVDLPDGTFTKTVWDAWVELVYDNNDTVKDSEWYARRTGTGDLAGTPEEAGAASKAAYHYNTPTTNYIDTLGRPFCTILHDKFSDPSVPGVDHYYKSYVDLDISGDRLAIHDARGLVPLTYKYNMLKAVVRQTSMDSGFEMILADAAGQLLYAADATDRSFHHTYDAQRRQLSKSVSGTIGNYMLEVMEYARE